MVSDAIDTIDEKLATDSFAYRTYESRIRAALHLGKKTLNRYYNKTDASEGCYVAIGEFIQYRLDFDLPSMFLPFRIFTTG